MPKQTRSRALVESILDATARVLIEDGFARTTTNRVAERAGVSVGSLYQYFPSREAVVAEVARRHSSRLKAAMETKYAANSASLRSAIASMLEAVLASHQVSTELTAVLAGEVPKLGKLDWKAEATRQGIDLARHLLERHKSELRRGLNREAAAVICATSVEGVMSAAALHARDSIIDGSVVKELNEMLVRYLAK